MWFIKYIKYVLFITDRDRLYVGVDAAANYDAGAVGVVVVDVVIVGAVLLCDSIYHIGIIIGLLV